MRRTLCIVAGIALAVGAVRADIVPDYVGGPPVPQSSGFLYRYDGEVVTDQRVDAGDFFTLYDFLGFVGTGVTGSHSEPSNWIFSSSNSGVNPIGTLPQDDPNIPNLTWTYVGPTIPGGSPLGQFSAVSSLNELDSDFFAAQATRSTGPNTGTKIFNIGTVTAPAPSVPEPAAIALIAPAMVLLKRHRRR